jgi:hypothetical protein
MSYDDGTHANPHQKHIPIWSEDRKPDGAVPVQQMWHSASGAVLGASQLSDQAAAATTETSQEQESGRGQ